MLQTNYLKVDQLKIFHSRNNIPIQNKNKAELKRSMQENLAARKIQLFFLHKKQNRCVVCRENLYPPLLCVYQQRYHTQCLIDYVNHTGKFEEVLLKRPLSLKDRRKIDHQCHHYNLNGIDIDYLQLEKEIERKDEESAILQTIYTMLNELEQEEEDDDNDSPRVGYPELEYFLSYFFALNSDYCIFILTNIITINLKDTAAKNLVYFFLQKLLERFKAYLELEPTSLNIIKTQFKIRYLQSQQIIRRQVMSFFLPNIGRSGRTDPLYDIDEEEEELFPRRGINLTQSTRGFHPMMTRRRLRESMDDTMSTST